jgi:thiosulfate reductase cytochrome b subunit
VVVIGVPIVLALLILSARSLMSLPAVQAFLTDYPGEYPLPEAAPVGFPAWLGWQHFLNAFLMLLIIRSGHQIRHETRPAAYWSPRWNRSRKISLTIWLHQSLDILWLLNGAAFVVLLFTTGQWMRIIPTSWDAFPNAASAALLYLSLDWPTENGWVNYNSLQQLAYATTVFVAAPLAAVTGLRMSGLWPQRAPWLNAIFPVGWARAIHYPTMVYFVIFIITHVTLVLASGALRNLNHMYAMRGGGDSNAYADNWTGFLIFAVSAVIMAAGWFAARPFVLAPMARLFGRVSSR